MKPLCCCTNPSSVCHAQRTPGVCFYLLVFIFFILGHQGAGVLSYFVFMKWLFFLNILIFALQFIFILVPQVAWTSSSYSSAVTGAGNSLNTNTVNTTRADTCSANYIVTTDTASYKVATDFLQGTVSITEHLF